MTESSGLVLVAAGSSARMQGTDKVWASLGNHPVVWWSLRRLTRSVDAVVLVVHPVRLAEAEALVHTEFPAVQVVQGGAVRQESVARGLAALPALDWVAVHDAARPFAAGQLLHDGHRLLGAAEGAIPVEQVRDTIKQVDTRGTVRKTVDRSELRACQTPQVFRATALIEAHRLARAAHVLGTDDAALVEVSGGTVATFPGHWTNFKITSRDDLELARLLVENGRVDLE